MNTVLITGASSGIGLELARIFADKGDRLCLVARDGAKLSELATSLARESGPQHIPLTSDLARPDAVERLVSQLGQERLTIDVLVNNAGFGSYGPFADGDLQRDLDMLQVNIVALTELTKRLLPGMLDRNAGKILNVASTAAFLPGPLMAVYYASKAYVLRFSEALAEETRSTGVTVTALCLGPTKTGFEDRAEVGKSRLFRNGTADPASVARSGYVALMACHTVAVPGLTNRVATLVPRLLPGSVAARMVKRAQAPSNS